MGVLIFAQNVRSQRLRRLMCGVAMPRRSHAVNKWGYAPGPGYALRFLGQRPNEGRSPMTSKALSARHSPAAHQAAKPLRTDALCKAGVLTW
jgi:hypothetical protein